MTVAILTILAAPFMAVPLFAIGVKIISSVTHMGEGKPADFPGGEAARKMVQRVIEDDAWKAANPNLARKELLSRINDTAWLGLRRLNDGELTRYVFIQREMIGKLSTADCAETARGSYKSDVYRLGDLVNDRDEWFTIIGDAALAESRKTSIEPLDTFGLGGALSQLRARSEPDILERMDKLKSPGIDDATACATLRQFFEGYARLEPESQALVARFLHTSE